MRVTRVSLRDFRNIERAEVELGSRRHRRDRAQRRGQDQPARGDLLRLHGPGGPLDERARAAPPRAPRRCASRCDVEGEGESHSIEVGFAPGRAQARAAGRRARGGAARLGGAPARERLPARPPRARQGRPGGAPAPARPPRGGALARPRPRPGPATPAPWRSATPCRADPRRRGGPGRPRRVGPELAGPRRPAHGRPARGRRPAWPRSSPPAPRTSACPAAAELRYRPRSSAHGRGRPGRGAGRAPSGRPRPRLHGARPAPRRPSAAPRRRAAARLWVAGPAAHGGARAALRRARPARGRAAPSAADAARRRDVGARRPAPRAPGGAARRGRPGRPDGHRPRARPAERGRTACASWRWTAAACRPPGARPPGRPRSWPHEPPHRARVGSRPLSSRWTAAAAPEGLLPRVQARWEELAGPAVAAEAEPLSERAGTRSRSRAARRSGPTSWSCLGDDLTERLNGALGTPAEPRPVSGAALRRRKARNGGKPRRARSAQNSAICRAFVTLAGRPSAGASLLSSEAAEVPPRPA